jgi:hypothetical protein
MRSTSSFSCPGLITNQSSCARTSWYSPIGTVSFSKQVSSPHSQTHLRLGHLQAVLHLLDPLVHLTKELLVLLDSRFPVHQPG